MKKVEAMELAPAKSKLLLEYINQILSDEEQVNARINVGSAKIDKEHMTTYEIFVPRRSFERKFNTGITTQQKDVLDSQILNDLVDNYLSSETVALSKFYWVRGASNFNGIDITGENGTKISINFGNIDKTIEDNYNTRLDEYVNTMQEGRSVLR